MPEHHLIDALRRGHVQVFVGSGLSSGIYPSADSLRELLLDETISFDGTSKTLESILPSPRNESLQDLAEYYELYNGRSALVDLIRREYGRPRNCTKAHADLWKLPGVKLIYTTNYDNLIEEGLQSPITAPDIACTLGQLQRLHKKQRESKGLRRIVFKPHGCAHTTESLDDFVITRSDYLAYSHRRVLEELKTLYDIFTRTFLFLGYSLSDSNMRRLLTEAKRLDASTRSYAVLERVSQPEVRAWHRLNVTLIEMTAEAFLRNLLEIFPADSSEWTEKVSLRTGDKSKIANIAVDLITDFISQTEADGVNIIVDSGTTCLAFADALLTKMEDQRIRNRRNEIERMSQADDGGDPKAATEEGANRVHKWLKSPCNINIITNSAPVVTAVSTDPRALSQGLKLFVTSGWLKQHTQAFIFRSRHVIEDLLQQEGARCYKTIAFIGATAFSDDRLETQTEDEVFAKRCFIDLADKVCVLVDHSKYKQLKNGKDFGRLAPSKMIIITDRSGAFSHIQGVKIVSGSEEAREAMDDVLLRSTAAKQ